jgi:hypothetical protein
MDCHDWAEHAITPRVTEFATEPLDQGRLQVDGDIGLDSCERLKDTCDHSQE